MTHCDTLQHIVSVTVATYSRHSVLQLHHFSHYGVATISRMLKNIGLFCKRALQKRPVFCKETCIFKHPTNRSHPIAMHESYDLSLLKAINYNRLQQTATDCNTLQHTASLSPRLSTFSLFLFGGTDRNDQGNATVVADVRALRLWLVYLFGS